MSTALALRPQPAADPFALGLRYLTAPYARGAATLVVPLGDASAGSSPVLAYDFTALQAQHALQSGGVAASYMLTLLVDQLAGPVLLDLVYTSVAGSGRVQLRVPSGTLAGSSFAVAPLPADASVVLQVLTEHPAPVAGEPSGPDKWALTALLGNIARLLWVLSGEAQVVAATARDVAAQHRLSTARSGSLDCIGADLRVPRLLPSPYRLDRDADTIALYHFDDSVAGVFDATHDYPGHSIGGQRGVAGKFGLGCRITAQGGLVIPDATAFAIDPAQGFTVELFVSLAVPPGVSDIVVFAIKRPHIDQAAAPGWSLALEPASVGHDLAFTMTDGSEVVVRAAATNVALPAGWNHIAAVVDPATKQTTVLLNGSPLASAPLGSLGVVDSGADICLGADRNGVALLDGALDEIRFSNVARTDFSRVLGPGAQPYAVDNRTVALYHLEESDDWINEDRGLHFAINRGASRGVPGRFGAGLRFPAPVLPRAHCAAEREFQSRLQTGAWNRGSGGAVVGMGPYARFGYRQGAISEPGLDGAMHPVMVNDQVAAGTPAEELVTTSCYGFVPDDPSNSNDPAQTIAAFLAAGRPVQEAIDYFGEWHGLPASFFAAQYLAHGITATYESCLPTPARPVSVLLPGAADFVFDSASSFTVEAFVAPEATNDDYARAVIAARSTALRPGEANPGELGWALSFGPYRSIPNNLRWVLGDAAGALVTVDANIGLADGQFHHLAGVVDRGVGLARLFVDGAELGQAALGALGAVAGSGPITLGNSPALTAPYAGRLDEVRISRGARRTFHPVLGESDARYRQRLAMFQPWRLPSYPAIRRIVQALTLSDPAQADVVGLLLGKSAAPEDLVQLAVEETDSTRFCASRWLRIVPQALRPGTSIAADGTTPVAEPDVSRLGPLSANSPALFSVPAGANFSFADPASSVMVLAAARALERLAARLALVSPATTLLIGSAYQPPGGPTNTTSNDNRGRAFTITLASAGVGFDAGTLAALAFETGVAFVACQPDGATVRVVATPGADLELTVATPNPGVDSAGRQVATIDQPIAISIRRPVPQLVNGVPPRLDWGVLPCGGAAGTLTLSGDGLSASFTGAAFGRATVELRYTLNDGSTVLVGALPVTIAPLTLDGCDALGGDGSSAPGESAMSGPPDTDFRADYLLSVTDLGIDFAPVSPAANRMQLPLESALLRLARLAAAEPGAPRTTVLAAYDPAATTLQAVGRGMVVAPSAVGLTAGRLAALAFVAGFSYIERRRYPPSVYVSVPPGDRFHVLAGKLKRLWPNARISGQGAFMATEFDAAGPPDAGFNPAILQPFTDARANFAAGVSNLVQPVLAGTLTALLGAIAADGVFGVLQVIDGFQPSSADLRSVGRAVLARHPALGAGRLSGYALQAGLGFVQHRTQDPGGPAVYMGCYASGQAPPDLLANSDPNAPYHEVALNMLTELSIRPQLNVHGRFDWSAEAACPAAAALSTSLLDPSNLPGITGKVFQGTAAGAVAVVATFSLNDHAEPYEFAIAPATGTHAAPRLSKDQYDDLLNFLDACHPLGISVVTKGLRGMVHGFTRPPRWDRLPTEATFPKYRVNT